ncbi:PH domain-containing protein [Prauserella cavernicola]|uniref:PH domain-containing protein n=1 Tax=Prauserella cavernicola TaxID=2800127 RepID=A0A934QWP9_9PSEU|nr:PH domain-containing protein [Prauserella cavernicola]MBK1787848.1 PH domain-containing protein [Prauserella cavernicola]
MTSSPIDSEYVVDDEAPVRLREPRHRLAPRAIVWWTLRAVITVGVVLGLLAALRAVAEAARPAIDQLLVGTAVAGVLYVAIMPTWRFLIHRWETTDEGVYSASGWLVRQWQIAPASRIQTVDTKRGPLQQLLGLATVTVTTASAQGPVKITGLDAEIASEAAGHLSRVTQRTTGDAT